MCDERGRKRGLNSKRGPLSFHPPLLWIAPKAHRKKALLMKASN
jgi:hypothetical protein